MGFDYSSIYNKVRRIPERFSRIGDVALIAIWPWIMPGDALTNSQWLNYLTHGQYTLKAAIEGIRNIPSLIVQYFPYLNRFI